jgi:hypothetical protein
MRLHLLARSGRGGDQIIEATNAMGKRVTELEDQVERRLSAAAEATVIDVISGKHRRRVR